MLWKFVLRVAIAAVLIVGVIVGVNYFVDASQVITPRGQDQMAELCAGGKHRGRPGEL